MPGGCAELLAFSSGHSLEQMVDLEELLERTRDAQAREHLREAVRCYQAGSYRSAIVATWVAVVLDLISKFRELEMTGNKAAGAKLEALDKARASNDVEYLLRFERDIVRNSQSEFELLTPLEQVDLDRLFADRNRSAHPSLLAIDEPYRPSAELTRTHMEASVRILLSQPPIQGAAAVARVFNDMKSEYFPRTVEAATDFLRKGALGKAKESLIRNLIIGLTKDLLNESRDRPELDRQFAGLGAIRALYPAEFKSVLGDNLEKIASNTPDSKTAQLVNFAGRLSDVWDLLGEQAQLRAMEMLNNGQEEAVKLCIGWALSLPALRDAALAWLPELSAESLVELLAQRIDRDAMPYCLAKWTGSRSWRSAEENISALIVPLSELLEPVDVQSIATAFESNGQIRYANETVAHLGQIFDRSRKANSYKPSWAAIYKVLCDDEYSRMRSESLREKLCLTFGFAPWVQPPPVDDADLPF